MAGAGDPEGAGGAQGGGGEADPVVVGGAVSCGAGDGEVAPGGHRGLREEDDAGVLGGGAGALTGDGDVPGARGDRTPRADLDADVVGGALAAGAGESANGIRESADFVGSGAGQDASGGSAFDVAERLGAVQ